MSNFFNAIVFRKHVVTKRVLDLNISLFEASKQIGVSKATLSRIENGKVPDVETFGRILIWLNEDAKQYFNNLKR